MPGWREAEWEAFRDRMRAERLAAESRAAAALTAFLIDGDGAGAAEPLAGDDEALFEFGVLAERFSRGLAGLAARAFGGWAAARRAKPGMVGSGRALVGGLPAEEYLAEEVGAELGTSRSQAAGKLHDATALVGRLPATLAALEAGEVDGERAHAMAALTDSLDDEKAKAVEQRVMARGGRSSQAAFRRAVRRAVAAVDPDAVAKRTRAAREDRRTWLQPHDDGTVDVGMTVPAELGLAVRQRVAALARRARRPGDARSTEQLRADVMLALLLGVTTDDLVANEGRVVPVEVLVTVAASTLAGIDDLPGELSGYGAIPDDVARELAEFGHWRKLLVDPVDGTPLGVGRSRFPTDRQQRAVRTRDGACRFMGCTLPAELCDLDHTVDHAKGGDTDEANLGPLCRRHHRMKGEDTGWMLVQTSPGHFTWSSPVGRDYHVSPEPPWLDDLPGTATAKASAAGGTAGRRRSGDDCGQWPGTDAEPPF